MIDLADFLIQFPEFAPAESSGLVQAKLDEAALSIGPCYGNQEDQAHANLAGHLLAISPFGRNARLVDDTTGSASAYFTRYSNIRRERAPRGFVT